MTTPTCLNCGSEIELIAEDLNDSTAIHCRIFTCGNCGGKNSVFFPGDEA